MTTETPAGDAEAMHFQISAGALPNGDMQLIAKRGGMAGAYPIGTITCQSDDPKVVAERLVELWNSALSPPAGGGAGKVWFGAMPESNGKSNWTALLISKDQTGFDAFADAVTIERSEYKDRVRYAADRARFVLGEIATRPDVLEYDPDLTEPALTAAPAPSVVSEGEAVAWRVVRPDGEQCFYLAKQRLDYPGLEGHSQTPLFAHPPTDETARLRARVAELEGLIGRVEPHIDAIVCYASTMEEHEPNRIAHEVRAIAGRTQDQLVGEAIAAQIIARIDAAHPTPQEETGWLVELKGRTPSWSTLFAGDYDDHWTEESTKAIRFARKVDAEAWIAWHGWTEAFASEHIWNDGRDRSSLAEDNAKLRARVEEECAQLVENEMPATQDMESTMICDALERAAKAIRARSNLGGE